MVQLNFPLIHSRSTDALSTIQIPLHQNIPNDTSLLTIRTNLPPLQLLDSQEAKLVWIFVRILFVAPMAIESEPIDWVPVLAVRNVWSIRVTEGRTLTLRYRL
jgi:hypothetical protein